MPELPERKRAFARRLTLALGGLLVAAAAGPTAAASAAVTLSLDPTTAAHGSTVTFSGAVTPAAVTPVEIYRWDGAAWRFVVRGDSEADGSYVLRAAVRAPGNVVARAGGDESAPVRLRIRPTLRARLEGLAIVGGNLRVRGRLRPRTAGVLQLTVRGRQRRVAVGATGRFSAPVSTRRAGRVRITLALRPAAGFASPRRTFVRRIQAPVLRLGSRGPAVRLLERRLRGLRYVVRGVNQRFGVETRDAVYAFEKVEGLGRDGVVDLRLWRRLLDARTPRPAVRRGRYVEVDKSRQVLFEVERGKVVRIMHVSTGATGNTPVGRWRIYRKSPGTNSLGMYYSLYFLRGFAMHGYASVPTFPASHGCVRVPMWYAFGLYSRWSLGDVVRVYA
jgi:hypothetical protein